jgi:hypothetical protein
MLRASNIKKLGCTQFARGVGGVGIGNARQNTPTSSLNCVTSIYINFATLGAIGWVGYFSASPQDPSSPGELSSRLARTALSKTSARACAWARVR